MRSLRTSIDAAKARNGRWSFVLQEFVDCRAASSPIDAAEIAAKELLALYKNTAPKSSHIISVAHLCQILGIELRGAKTSMSRAALDLEELAYTRHRHGSRAKLAFQNGQPVISVYDLNKARARLSVAHEIGHYVIHQRRTGIDRTTLRVESSPEEEALAEYIGRLLLVPRRTVESVSEKRAISALTILEIASAAYVSIHAAASRLVDPDSKETRIIGSILWSMRRASDQISGADHMAHRFAPDWHLCPGYFVPVGKCHIRHDSSLARLVDDEAEASNTLQEKLAKTSLPAEETEEDVSIGSLIGRYAVSGIAWGSTLKKSRLLLSVFLKTKT